MTLFHWTTIPSVYRPPPRPLTIVRDSYEAVFRRAMYAIRYSGLFVTGDHARIIVWGPDGSQYRDITLDPIVKTCSCGTQFTFEEWSELPGIDPWIDDLVILDMRECPCGSHISLPVAYSIDQAGREEATHA